MTLSIELQLSVNVLLCLNMRQQMEVSRFGIGAACFDIGATHFEMGLAQN